MKKFDDSALRGLLSLYEVSGPGFELVTDTKALMREEVKLAAVTAPAQETGVFVVVGLSIAMSLCLFYMFTVGTILRFVLPPSLLDVLRHTIYALTAAGGSVMVGAFMMLALKVIWMKRPEQEPMQLPPALILSQIIIQ